MEKIVIYDACLIFMLYMLYKMGWILSRDWKFFSRAGLFTILVFTLNEGLRFGRGIDYNAYWKVYDRIAMGAENDDIYVNMDIGFYYFCKGLSSIGISWQGCVITMSCIFIMSSLFFLKNYRDSIQYALPLWVLFSFNQTENVMRWFLGFSLIITGLSLLIQKQEIKNIIYYVSLSTLGCLMHFGLIPVVLLFGVLHYKNKPLLSPGFAFIGLLITVMIAQIDNLMGFANFFNYFALMTDRFAGYAEDTEYWMLKSSSIGNLNTFTGIIDFVCSLFILLLGYKKCLYEEKKYIFAYNLFLIAFLFRPITTQMELFNRYDTLLYIFRALVYAKILQDMFLHQKAKRRLSWAPMMMIILILNIAQPLLVPFKNDPRKYLYVWNKEDLTSDKMYEIYFNDNH